MKAIEQNVHMVPFLLQKVNFQFVDQMPSCDHSNCTILSYAGHKRVGFGKEEGKQDTVDYHSKLLFVTTKKDYCQKPRMLIALCFPDAK